MIRAYYKGVANLDALALIASSKLIEEACSKTIIKGRIDPSEITGFRKQLPQVTHDLKIQLDIQYGLNLERGGQWPERSR